MADTFKSSRPRFSVREGEFLRKWGSKGSKPGQLKDPSDVKISALGETRCSYQTSYNYRVCVFRPDGTFLRALGGEEGSGDGQLSLPKGLL